MIYCYHCGKRIDEEKLEVASSTREKFAENINEETKIEYVCPRCGHLTHHDGSEEDVKSLSRACHAELQRGRNSFAKGMCSAVLALILLTTAIIFMQLSKKADNQFKITVNTPEFWVFIVLSIISVILIVYGAIQIFIGLRKKLIYSKLLKDIHLKTFVQ